MKGPPCQLKFFFGFAHILDLFETGNHLGNCFADPIGILHQTPVDRPLVSQHTTGNCGDNFDFAFGTNMASRTTIAQPNIVEHRFLRR